MELITNEAKPRAASIADQRQVIFEPIILSADHQYHLPEFTTEIFLSVDKDINLNGLYFGKYSNAPLMIYFQGNAKNLQNFLDNHAMVLGWGYNVLVTDYRGFGKSGGGIMGEDQLYADAEQVYELAITLGYSPEQIILYGYSMGAAMVSHLASCKPAKALILESGYSSVDEMDFANGLCPDFELNNAEKAKQIHIPALVIHGRFDTIITPDHADRIFNNLATEIKQKTILDGAHGDLKVLPGYSSIIHGFIEKLSAE